MSKDRKPQFQGPHVNVIIIKYKLKLCFFFLASFIAC